MDNLFKQQYNNTCPFNEIIITLSNTCLVTSENLQATIGIDEEEC